jgi:hypothetical protein
MAGIRGEYPVVRVFQSYANQAIHHEREAAFGHSLVPLAAYHVKEDDVLMQTLYGVIRQRDWDPFLFVVDGWDGRR